MTYEDIRVAVYNACPYKDRPFVTTKVGKDSKFMSVYLYRQLALRFMLGKKVSHIEIDGEYDSKMEKICSNRKIVDSESGQKLRLYLDESFDAEAFFAHMPEICADCKAIAPVNSFGCCSLYVECSDAKECLRWQDEDYLGCEYRRNLEAGRIFYGQNENYA